MLIKSRQVVVRWVHLSVNLFPLTPLGVRFGAVRRATSARSALSEQAGGADGGAAEAVDRPVGGAVGVVPTALRLPQHELPVHPLTREQALDPDRDQPDPGALEPERVVEPGRRLVDLDGHVGGLGQRAGPGDGGEVGEPDGDRHGAPGDPRHPHPATDLRRQPQQLAHHDLPVVGVPGLGDGLQLSVRERNGLNVRQSDLYIIVAAAFGQLADAESARFRRIDASLAPDRVHASVLEALGAFLQ